jgi:hypothetical protein
LYWLLADCLSPLSGAVPNLSTNHNTGQQSQLQNYAVIDEEEGWNFNCTIFLVDWRKKVHSCAQKKLSALEPGAIASFTFALSFFKKPISERLPLVLALSFTSS